MSNTEQTIQDGIAGGWKGVPQPFCIECGCYSKHSASGTQEVFLDPTFWQAVGKTRGWANPESRSHHITATDMETSMQTYNGVWMQNWTDFIQWLADGKTIEEALTEIS